MLRLSRIIPLAIIILMMAAYYIFDLGQYFTFMQLKEKHHQLKAFVDAHSILAPILFTSLYILTIALSIPIAGILSLGMGYLFPLPFSTLLVVIGATIGATCIFLAAKTALANLLYEKVKPFLSKFDKLLKENGSLYLITLRLIPLIPFWLLNLAPAFLGISLRTFIWTTFVGIIPGSFVFTQAGSGLASVLESDATTFSFGALFTPQVVIAFCLLIAFSLIPIIYKHFKKR